MASPISLLLPAHVLAAALHCVATNDVRFYLNGVCVEVKRGEGTICSTNGQVLFAAHFVPLDKCPDVCVIVPRALLAGIRNRRITSRSTVNVELRIEGRQLTVDDGDVARTAPSIEGTFPRWRAAVPHPISGEAGFYNPALVQVMDKVASCLGEKNPCLQQNGKHGAVCVLDQGNALFVIMPWLPERARPVPNWALPAEVHHAAG